MELTWKDFDDAATTIIEITNEEAKDRLVAASFTAWQLGSGDGKGFRAYLRDLGLAESELKMTSEQKKKLSEKSIRIAERIARMDTRQ